MPHFRQNCECPIFDPSPLPIDATLPELTAALATRNAAVLVAPPGAGKTTRVPLALLDAKWLAGRKIFVLEPRRLAARAAAARMATTLGQSIGETVGLRARLASKVGPKTRLEVVTEGVFARMILDDPTLDGVGAVLFDEFHERSLDADLGLALALDAQSALREDLRILIMSATLDGARVASLLDDAPVVTSDGRAFDVETRYLGRDPAARIEDQVVRAIRTALATERGSILAFLPGQGEILRTAERLSEHISDPSIDILPLFGAMDIAAQTHAIAPAAPGRRKVVLATSIAETSITIDGVRVVVDSGLARVPRYEPDVGVTRLETVRVSRAAADQRRGRAGRTESGVCYRLWDQPQTQSLKPYADPEILSADLAGLVLDCAEWGTTDLSQLRFLDPPPVAARAAARTELRSLDAIDAENRITDTGRRLRALPLPPRLARMVVAAAALDRDAARTAADIAAVIVERGLGGTDTDLTHRLEAYRRDRSRRATDMRRLAEGWARTALDTTAIAASDTSGHAFTGDASPAALLALAYPDRIAKARGAPGEFLLANGRGARLPDTDALARVPWLIVAEMSGSAAATRIQAAMPAAEDTIRTVAHHRIVETDDVTFDTSAAAIRARRVRRLDAIVLSSEPRPAPADMDTVVVLARGLAQRGIDRLPWSKAQQQVRDRAAFLRTLSPADWPDLSDEGLAATVETWLAPFLLGRTRAADVDAETLAEALDTLLPWTLRQRLDAEAPTHYEAPSGNRHAIVYEGAGAPILAIRVQELFGLKVHPSIANGRLPLTLHLLSPAHRPIQITRDLPGFWSGSWTAVKTEMKGRYPRHVWPDDPASAAPTARAKPRGT